jgi:hypothetical protein
LLAHNTQRNPQLTSYVETIIQVINNVVYNWAYKGCYFSNKPNANVIGNYFRRGPDTRQQRYEIGLSDFTGRIYVKDNLGPHRQKQGMDNWAVVGTGENHKDPAPSSYQALKPFPAPRITVQPVMEAYQLVIQNAGSMIPWRDAVDKRILQDAKDGTGRIIDDPSDVGGWPVLSAGTPREDTDHDGMPDAWEVAHDLDPRDSSDANGKDLSPEGYTNIEMFLNGLMIQGP